MACKDMNTVIDDQPVYVRQWPATVATENLSMALQICGADFGAFVEGEYTFDDIIRVMYSADSAKLISMLKKFVVAARIDGQEIQEATFNPTYSGDLMKIFQIFSFVCEVNYKDFFMQGRELNNARKADLQKAQAQQQVEAEAKKNMIP